jgi:hypothetical protein
MMMNSASLLLLRGISASLLMLLDQRYFMWCYSADMCIYLLLKIARGDFWYWIPLDGATGLGISLIMRVTAKTIVDFTGIVQFRGPAEMGGLCWSANMITAIAVSFAAIELYYSRTAAEKVAVAESTMWTILKFLSGVGFEFWVFSVAG